ncbi:MAG: TMAO reductase system periplasmic protein TorT [Allgaiera sp.]|nr:TMAO reductase system periplasmic protein TorT [Allgaiera sp.]
MKHTLMTALLAGAMTLPAMAAMADWAPYPAEQVVPPFSTDGKAEPVTYVPLKKADKKWNICVSFPHMKDPYWLGVDYGVVAQAKAEGVKLHVVAADGYTNLNQQISQIQDCVAAGAQAVVVGAISYTGLNGLIEQMKGKGIPWIDVINGVSSPDIAAKSLVSFYTMGAETGKYLAAKHPAGSKEITVGWFPGPAGAGWVEAANKGFLAAVKGSAIKVLEPKYGDTGEEAQLNLQPPTAGRVTLNGAEITGLSTAAVMARGLHYLSPDRKAEGLILTRSARDNIGLDLAMNPDFRRAGWIDRRALRRQVAQTAGRVTLSPDYLPRPVSQLSGGNQQKVLFAKCFARPAQVYLLDEPTVGVDMGTRAALYQLIRQLAEAGNAVLVVSSDLPEVMNLSHRVLVMAHGRLRADLDGAEITEDRVLKHFFDEAETEHAG